jgi:hypothetical protein
LSSGELPRDARTHQSSPTSSISDIDIDRARHNCVLYSGEIALGSVLMKDVGWTWGVHLEQKTCPKQKVFLKIKKNNYANVFKHKKIAKLFFKK